MGKARGILSAISAYFTAFDMISRSRRFASFIVIPFVLNIALLASVVYLAAVVLYPQMAHFFSDTIAHLPAALKSAMPVFSSEHSSLFGALSSVCVFLAKSAAFAGKTLFVIILVLFVYFTYSISGSILSAPFLDMISLRAEQLYTRGNVSIEPMGFFVSIFRALANAVKLLLLVICINIVLLLLNLIPVAGTFLYSASNYFVIFFLIGFNFFDFPFERRKMKFRAKLRAALANYWAVAGLGLVFFVTSAIPVFGFISLSLCSASAGIMYHSLPSGLAERKK